MTTAHSSKASESFAPARVPVPWAWLVFLTVLGLALRVIGLNRGLWLDEIIFLTVTVRHPLAEIVTVFPGDTQHPLYSVLARLSVLAFGEHAWTLRLPAVVFGVASIPALYFLAAAVANRTQALICAAFLAISYHHVWFSQNARGYSALAFFTIIATLFLLRGLRTGRKGPYIAYAIAAALGVYTHLAMMFLIASHVLICAVEVWMDWRQGRSLEKWKLPLKALCAAGGMTLLLYAPIVMQVQKFFLKGPSPMKAVSTPSWALWETIRGLAIGLGANGVLVVAGLVVACGAWSYFKQDRLVFALLAVPAVLTVGAVAVRGTLYPRFFFSLIGFAVIILVRGLFVLPGWILARWNGTDARLAPALSAGLVTILLAVSAFSLERNYKYPKQDFEAAIRFVEAARVDGEPVVTAGASTDPVIGYYEKPWEGIDSVEQLQAIFDRGRPVWAIYTFPRYLQDWSPPIARMILSDFAVVKVFPGTVGDGDVFVAKSKPQ